MRSDDKEKCTNRQDCRTGRQAKHSLGTVLDIISRWLETLLGLMSWWRSSTCLVERGFATATAKLRNQYI
jgi:hypothetical protein